jgi:hypothetical protein
VLIKVSPSSGWNRLHPPNPSDNIVKPSIGHAEKIKNRREGRREVAITDVLTAGEWEGRSNSKISKNDSRYSFVYYSYPSPINW